MRLKFTLTIFWLLAILLNQQAMLQTCSAEGKLGLFTNHLVLIWVLLAFISLGVILAKQNFLIGIMTIVTYGLATFSLFVFSQAQPPCLQTSIWYILAWVALWHLGLILIHPQSGTRLILILFSLIFTFTLLEGGIRVYFRLDAIENTAIMKPHPQVGWTWIPNHNFLWRERNPACSSFRIDVHTNSFGFVDAEPVLEKSPHITRIAVLGDSFVEAIQVPLQARATNLLADKLGDSYEVQNWGMSAFSVGQMWLNYQYLVKDFQPDYVLILLSELVLIRTPETGVELSQNDNTRLSLRPVFRWDGSGIYALAANDYPLAEALYWSDLVDEHEKPKLPPIYLAPIQDITWSNWRETPYEALRQESQWVNFLNYRLKGFWGTFAQQNFDIPINTSPRANYYIGSESHRELLAANYAVLAQWAEEVQADSAEMIWVDDTLTPFLSHELEELSRSLGVAYIPTGAKIQALAESGIATHFLCDGHYTSEGQAVLGQAMADWFLANP